MPIADLTKIERSVLIRAPRSRVWRAIAEVKEFSAWFQVKAEGRFAPGARVRMVSTHPECSGVVVNVIIQDVVPEQRFSWKWHPGMPGPGEDISAEPMTLVEFHLSDEGGGTRVTVIESGFDLLTLAKRSRVFDENDKGWAEQLAALGRYLP